MVRNPLIRNTVIKLSEWLVTQVLLTNSRQVADCVDLPASLLTLAALVTYCINWKHWELDLLILAKFAFQVNLLYIPDTAYTSCSRPVIINSFIGVLANNQLCITLSVPCACFNRLASALPQGSEHNHYTFLFFVGRIASTAEVITGVLDMLKVPVPKLLET